MKNMISILLPNFKHCFLTIALMTLARMGMAQCEQLFVDISTPCLTRCQENTWNVKYCNTSATAADSVLVVVSLDGSLDFQSATLPATGQVGNVYFFYIGAMQAGECDTFSITTFLDCDAAPGQAHCTSAYIFPDDNCQSPGANWDGAEIAVEAVCEGDSVILTIRNEGAGDMQDSAKFIIIEDDIVVMFDSYNLPNGSSFSLGFPADGSTWHLAAEQSAGFPGFSFPSVTLEGCTLGNDFTTGFTTMFAEDDMRLNVDHTCMANTDSCASFDKIVFPEGVGAENCINNDQSIEYQINFQNTTPYAIDSVIICDTLSGFLNPTTLLAGASTHGYDVSVMSGGVVKFFFEDINLQPGEQGFVKFTVFQNPDNPVGTIIENYALVWLDTALFLTDTTSLSICTPLIISDDIYLCAGSNYNGQYYGQDTTLTTLGHFANFDVNQMVNLHFVDTIPSDMEVTICLGEAYIFQDSILTEPGEYWILHADTLTCDTLYHLTLNVDSTCFNCIADAGPDTLVCGFEYTLVGSPASGNWKPLCPLEPGLVSFSNETDSTATVRVTKCGSYWFIYTHFRVDTLLVFDTATMSLVPKLDTCEASDLVIVDFEDPSFASITAELTLEVVYDDYTCHEDVVLPCNVNVIDISAVEPEALWELSMTQSCEAHIYQAVPFGVVDACEVDNIILSTDTSIVVGDSVITSHPQGDVVILDTTGIINADSVLQLIDSILNASSVECTDIPEGCFGDGLSLICHPDTLQLRVPIRLGGHWTWLPQGGGSVELLDTTFFDYANRPMMHILLPNSQTYNPQFQLWQWYPSDTIWGAPDTLVAMTYQWVEDWIWDSITYIGQSCVLTGTVCGGRTAGLRACLPGVVPPYDCPPFTIIFSGERLLAKAPAQVQLNCLEPCVSIVGTYSTNIAGQPIFSWCDSSGNVLSNTNTVVVCTEGEYIFKVTINGCTDMTTTQVLAPLQPEADAGPDRWLSCDSITVVLLGSANMPVVNYEWEGPGIDDSNRNLQNPAVTVAGMYILTVTAANGCTDSDSTQVSQNLLAPLANAGEDTMFPCNADTLTLQGSAQPDSTAMNVLWWTQDGQILSGDTTLQPTVGLPGTYVLEVRLESSGCLHRDTVQVNDYEPIAFAVESTSSCSNDGTGILHAVNLTGGLPPYSFSLDSGATQTSPSFAELFPGDYLLSVLDSVGCGDSILTAVAAIPPMPTLEFEQEYAICGEMDTLRLDVTANYPGLDYFWANGWDSSVVFINKWGTYHLEITNGCEVQEFEFNVEDSLRLFSLFDVPNAFTPNGDQLNETFLPVSLIQPVSFDMKIFGRWGELYYDTESFIGWDGTYKGKDLPSDVYIYMLQATYMSCNGKKVTYSRKGDVTLLR